VLRGDEARLTIHETIVQDLPLELFTTLEANDILFIDSSHVLKLGSDVSMLFLDACRGSRPASSSTSTTTPRRSSTRSSGTTRGAPGTRRRPCGRS
jgi:hypothetical protein